MKNSENRITLFRKFLKIFFRILTIIIIVYAVIGVFVMLFEEKFIYFPTKYPDGPWDDLKYLDRKVIKGNTFLVEECFFTTSDGVKLNAVAYKTEKCKMWLLWFHGNAGNISYRFDMMEFLARIPVNIFLVDYRGYGKSEGEPSEEGLYKDAVASYEYLLKEYAGSSENIIIFGKSLGGAIAVDLASKKSAAGLIVQSSFTRAKDMASQVIPLIPVGFFLKTKFDSVSKVKDIRIPKLFIHSKSDEVVPYELGWKLFESACEPKEFYEVKNAHHNDTYIVGGEEYLNRIADFVRKVEHTSK